MKKSKAIILGVVTCGVVLTACVVYAAQPQMFEVSAFRSAISTLEGNYTDHSVLASNLKSLSAEVTKLNARLALDDVFSNEDEIKQTVVDADALVARVDLADPLVTVDDAEQSGVELEALKTSLGIALDNYGLSHAVVTVERIDLATPTHEGFVGDVVTLTPAVYPTMVKDTVLSYTSSDEAVVTVDESGSVVLAGAGSAEVTVTDTQTGVHTQMTVTSKAVPVQAKPQTQAPAQVQAPAQTQTPPAQVQAPAQVQTPPARVEGGTQQPQTPPTQKKPSTSKPSGGGTVYEPQFTDDFQESYDGMKEATGGKAGTAGELADLSQEERQAIYDNYNW